MWPWKVKSRWCHTTSKCITWTWPSHKFARMRYCSIDALVIIIIILAWLHVLFDRFHVSHTTWKYEICISNCQVNGSSVSSTCPVEVLTRAGGRPTNQSGPDSHYENCRSLKNCSLKVTGPNIDRLHYVQIGKLTDVALTFTVEVKLTGKLVFLIHYLI